MSPPLVLAKSPCVGLCSTSLGDLVCRGCLRYAHEITDWNGYAEALKNQVWARITQHTEIIIYQHLRIRDPERWQITQSLWPERWLHQHPAYRLWTWLRTAPALETAWENSGLQALQIQDLDTLRKTVREELLKLAQAQWDYAYGRYPSANCSAQRGNSK